MKKIILISLLAFLNLNVIAQCIAEAGRDSIYCSDNPDTIRLGGKPSAIGGIQPYTYSWSSLYPDLPFSVKGNILNDTAIANPILIKGVLETKLLLEVTDAKGNKCIDSIYVRRTWPAIIDLLVKRQTINLGDSTKLYSGVHVEGFPPYTYLWAPSDGLTDRTNVNTYAKPKDSTYYTLTITDSVGCTYFDEFWVDVRGNVSTHNQLDGNYLKIYPNPSKNKLYIKLENIESKNIEVSILNQMGVQIMNFDELKELIEVDITGIPSGFYFIKITDNDKLLAIKKVRIK